MNNIIDSNKTVEMATKAPMTTEEENNRLKQRLERLQQELEIAEKINKEVKEMADKYRISFETLVKTISK